MILILDDVLQEQDKKNVFNYFDSLETPSLFQWVEGDVFSISNLDLPISKLLSTAKEYINLREMIGCEFWSHYGTKPQKHIDKDEKLMATQGILKCPMWSIVYYAKIKNLKGGKFFTDTETITPLENRMIIFESNTYHSVEDYSGTRMSVAINPWKERPILYTELITKGQ